MPKPIYPFGYLGGKLTKLKFILPLLPTDSKHLVDVFGGSGAVVFNAGDRFLQRTYNDLDLRLFHFFQTLRANPDELALQILLTPHSVKEFRLAQNWDEPGLDDLEKARRAYVSITQAVNRVTLPGTGAMWSFCKGDAKLPRPKGQIKRLLQVADALLDVSLENLTWQKILKRYDHPNVTFYLDPPYLPSTRAGGIQYKHELTEADHAELVAAIRDLQAKVLLSGYDNALYNAALPPPLWQQIKAPPRVISSAAIFNRNQSKSIRQECCWRNYGDGAKLELQ